MSKVEIIEARAVTAPGRWFIDPYRNICDVRGKAVDFHDPANAAFIVRACNSHYELLEALEEAAVLLLLLGAEDGEGTILAQARAAIAKARPPAGETK